MTDHSLHLVQFRNFEPVPEYERDPVPRRYDALWSIAGVIFIAAATTVLVEEDWPGALVAASEAAESTAPAGALIPPLPDRTALAADIVVAPLSSDDVRQIQARLAELGFDPGQIDGIAGTRTLNALNAYRGARYLGPAAAVDYDSAADLLD